MPSRREVLQAGLAVAALPWRAHALPAATVQHASPVYTVLYDTRFPASVAFGRRAAERGLAVHAIAGDMTRFWYDDLYHRWRAGPATVAGLTAHGALFCLERLAWDHRLRIVFRGEHAWGPGSAFVHRFAASAGWLQAATRVIANDDWSAALCDVVTAMPGRFDRAAAAAAAATGQPAMGDVLFSWVIAPVQRG